MNIEDIKLKITELAKKHEALDMPTTDEIQFAEMIEEEAEDLIVKYCEHQGYVIDGFPTEKRKLPEEELEEDYFCLERFRLYLDRLALQKDDVAELLWFYNKSFGPDWYSNMSKSDFLEQTKDHLRWGYDIEL